LNQDVSHIDLSMNNKLIGLCRYDIDVFKDSFDLNIALIEALILVVI